MPGGGDGQEAAGKAHEPQTASQGWVDWTNYSETKSQIDSMDAQTCTGLRTKRRFFKLGKHRSLVYSVVHKPLEASFAWKIKKQNKTKKRIQCIPCT